MPTFLSDPSATTFVVLAVILAGTVFYWYRTQTRRGLYVMAAGVGLFALVLLCDELVESPREEAVQRIETLILAINESRPRTVAEQVSPQFRYGSITKDTLESARLWTLLREHNTSVAAWDFDRGYVE